MGGLVESVFGSDRETTTNSGGSWSNEAWTPEMEGLYNDLINDVITNGVPQGPGYVGLNETQTGALAGLGIGGAAGQYYQGVLSGQGQEARQQALQQSQEAAGAQAAQYLEGVQNTTQSQFGAAGNTGSRMNIQQGINQAQVQTGLASHFADQNMAFQKNEQNLMSQAANNLQSIYGQQFGAGSVLQGDEREKALAAWKEKYGQTNAGMFEFLANYMNAISGVAGGTQTGTSQGNSSHSGLFGLF